LNISSIYINVGCYCTERENLDKEDSTGELLA